MIPTRSPEAKAVIVGWHQETRDLSLILSRKTGATVSEKIPRKHQSDPNQRQKDEFTELKERNRLVTVLNVPDAASAVEVTADMNRRSIEVGMTLRAPEDKKTTKARLNWLLRQIKTESADGLHVKLLWPGKSEPTQHSVQELRANVAICDEGKEHVVAHGFHVFVSKDLGVRFAQPANFIADLEAIVPDFYGRVGADLKAWQRPAPRIREAAPDQEDEVDDTADAYLNG